MNYNYNVIFFAFPIIITWILMSNQAITPLMQTTKALEQGVIYVHS